VSAAFSRRNERMPPPGSAHDASASAALATPTPLSSSNALEQVR
jgi:hypothetical protein